MPRPASPTRLPASAHVDGPTGRDEIVHRPEEGVAARERQASVTHAGEIDLARLEVRGRLLVDRLAEVRHDLAEDPQPRDAAIRIDVQAHVRVGASVLHGEEVLRAGTKRSLRQHLGPGRPLELTLGRVRCLEGCIGRVVSEEVRGVDVEPANAPRYPEFDDAPVVPVPTLSAALPAIHPLPAVGELVRQEDGGFGLHQVLALGEEVVIGGDGFATHGRGGEVDQADEGRGAFRRSSHESLCSRGAPRGEPNSSGAPRSKIDAPRSQVRSTRPRSRLPR